MHLEKLSLQNIRIYEKLHLEISAETTVFLGSNGVGKTTILETIYVFASLQSFRTSRIKDLLRDGQDKASAELVCRTDIVNRLSLEIFDEKPKILQRNEKNVRGPKFIEDLRVVALVPEHQRLLDLGAEERRRFLDRVVYSGDSSFLDIYKRYQKTLRHKRALLRRELPLNHYLDQVSVWNEELVRLGTKIRAKRKETTEKLHGIFVQEHEKIGDGEVSLKYEFAEENLEECLAEKAAKEHLVGRVLYGPHRDDLSVSLRNRRAHEGASQGERASLLLALKFSEMSLFRQNSQAPMVLLLDDLGATLDPKRRKKLFERINQERVQTLITTTDEMIAEAAKSHQGSVSEVRLDENPTGFSFAPRQAT